MLGASASATNCIDKTPRRGGIRKTVARALPAATYAAPMTFDDGPAKQVKRDRELIIACDVARGIDSPPVLAAFEVLCHDKDIAHTETLKSNAETESPPCPVIQIFD